MENNQVLLQNVNVTVIEDIDRKDPAQNQSENVRKRQTGRKVENLIGQKFGMLTVLERVQNHNKQVRWKCLCDCGEYTTASLRSLKTGKKRSCGCLKIESQKMIRDRLSITDGTCIEWLEGRKMRLDNKSGCKGVTRRKNGKYCVSIGFKKKIYYLGIFDDYESAVEARKKGEEMIHGTFLKSYALWKKMNDESPGWGEQHPFQFDVRKEHGEITIYNSMEEFGFFNTE